MLHTQSGHSASGFGGDQSGQGHGSAQPYGSEDEGESGWRDDPNKDIFIAGPKYPGAALNEGLVHVDHAL